MKKVLLISGPNGYVKYPMTSKGLEEADSVMKYYISIKELFMVRIITQNELEQYGIAFFFKGN